jgi:hypothetical protein
MIGYALAIAKALDQLIENKKALQRNLGDFVEGPASEKDSG